MRTCFLHAGAHKTGTSAIQRFLYEQRDALSARGYLVPSTGMRYGSHHQLVRRAAGLQTHPRHQNCLEQLRIELHQIDCTHVIISSEAVEAFVGRTGDFAGLVGYLNDLGLKVEMVYYVRNHAQLFNSQYVQRTKLFRRNDSFTGYVSRRLSRLERSYLSIVEEFRRTGVETLARPYNRQVCRAGLVRDFLDTIGLIDFKADQNVIVNPSPGPVAVEAARRTMDGIGRSLARLGNSYAVQCGAALASVVEETGFREPAYCGLTTQSARMIEDAFGADSEAFARKVWSCSWAEMFPEDVGQEFEPNDIAMIPPTHEQQLALQRILADLEPRVQEILQRA